MPPKKKNDERPKLKDCKIIGKAITPKPEDLPEDFENYKTKMEHTVLTISKLLQTKSKMIMQITGNANIVE